MALLFIANTINIAADLARDGAMPLKLLIGGPGILYVIVFGVDLGRGADLSRLQALRVGAEMADAAACSPMSQRWRSRHVPWGEALTGVLVPRLTWSADYFTTIVAIFGTTISPYLFFWQASQEAEDQRIDVNKQPLIDKHRQARKRNFTASAPIPSSEWRSPI